MNNTKILLAQQVQMNMRKVCLDLKAIAAFKYCFAQLAVISFVWKLSLTRLLAFMQETFSLATQTMPPNLHLPKNKTTWHKCLL